MNLGNFVWSHDQIIRRLCTMLVLICHSNNQIVNSSIIRPFLTTRPFSGQITSYTDSAMVRVIRLSYDLEKHEFHWWIQITFMILKWNFGGLRFVSVDHILVLSQGDGSLSCTEFNMQVRQKSQCKFDRVDNSSSHSLFDKSTWLSFQVDIIIWQVMAEICHQNHV